MLIGWRVGSLAARWTSPAPSAHACRGVYTTDAVAGGCSVANAIGSAFCCHPPSLPQTEYLYLVPSPTPGTNSSHTPDPPRLRIGWAVPSQKLKSPLTRMPRAFGAQTAKEV